MGKGQITQFRYFTEFQYRPRLAELEKKVERLPLGYRLLYLWTVGVTHVIPTSKFQPTDYATCASGKANAEVDGFCSANAVRLWNMGPGRSEVISVLHM